MNFKIRRRQLLLGLLSTSVLAGCKKAIVDDSELNKITEKILNLPELDPPYTDNVEFDVFYRLCQLVTSKIDLDEDVARKIYDLNQREPFGTFHAAAVYQIITDGFYDSGVVQTIPSLVENGAFNSSEEWYLTHLLTTWNLGIYYHEDIVEPVRVSFGSSLMWEAVEGIMPVPGMSDLEPRYWQNEPQLVPEVK